MIRVDGYPLDAAIEERLTYEAEVTEFPVEKGANVSDHVRAKRPTLELDGIVSDTPTGAIAEDATRQSLAGGVLPSRDAFEFFVKLHGDRRAVSVECSFGKFDDMVLTSLTPVRNKETLKAFKFTATFQTIEFAQNNRTTIRVAVPNQGGRKNLGTLAGILKDLNVTFVASSKADSSIRAEKLRQGYRLVSTTTHQQRLETWRKSHDPTPEIALDELTGPEAAAARSGFDPFAAFGSPGNVDHYFADQTETSDGYVTGHNKQDYYPYVNHVSETSIAGKPVHWDYRTDSWVDDESNKIVQKPPKGQDRWKNVTLVRSPGPKP